MGHTLHRQFVEHLYHRRGVEHRGLEQHVGGGAVGAGQHLVQLQRLQHDAAHQGEAVRPQVRRCQADHGVAGPDRTPVDVLALLHDADCCTGEIEGVGLHHPGMLRRLAAEQRNAGLGAGGGDRAHDPPDPGDVDRPDGDVVGHRDRPRPGGDEVVDAHRHEVVAETVDVIRSASHLRLGADTVGRHHQHRPRVALGHADPGGEASEPAGDAGAPGRRDRVTDRVDDRIGRFEIDPGVAVRRHGSAPLEHVFVAGVRHVRRVVAGQAGGAEPRVLDAGRLDQHVEVEIGE